MTISDRAHQVLTKRRKRAKYQRGWVEETGRKTKKWKGHYYSYEMGSDGLERRVHRAVILGLKSELRKNEAQKRLQEIIDREVNGKIATPSAEVTWGWFAENRCLPIWRDNWKASHAKNTEYSIRRFTIAPFADRPLSSIDRFSLQVYLNELAKKASRSVVQKFCTWSRAICEEAVEQDYMSKNPARKLTMPSIVRPENRRHLSADEITALLGALGGRDALILRMYLILGLRARELFALRRDDLRVDQICINETLDVRNQFFGTKTATSTAWIWMPDGLAADIWKWADGMDDRSDDALLFQAPCGSPVRSDAWREDVLKPTAKRLGINGVTIQALRRTCATMLKGHGDLKDVQSHLRHANPEITAGTYIQEVPAQVRAAVQALEAALRSTVEGA